MTYERDGYHLMRFIVALCKFRRMVTLCGIIVCSFLLFKVVYRNYNSMRNLPEYTVSEAYTGHKKNPKDLPGYFMKGKHPTDNASYCNFNYGLPNKLDWSKVSVAGSPQLGRKSPYRVIYNAIERTMYDKFYVLDQVTYATHVTPEFTYHVVEIARFWDGPISVAAFVPDYDFEITMKLFSQLCRCYEGMSKVSLHLVFPQHDRPRFLKNEEEGMFGRMRRKKVKIPKIEDIMISANDSDKGNITDKRPSDDPSGKNMSHNQKKKHVNLALLDYKLKERKLLLWFQDCSMPDMTEVITFRTRHGLIYPVNVGRNVARNASTTQYNLVSDVEMIPSEGLATKFTMMVKKQKIIGHYGIIPKWRLAFVIPVFEVESGEDVPRNKSTLQQLYAEGKAVYFHRWVCSHCQKIPDLQNWIKEDPGNVIKPFAVTKRQFPYHRWEPIYIATRHTPWYSETLSWEGRQDKMTQMLEMCLKSYDFVIVNGAFLCHAPGIKSKSKHKSWRYRHELVNTKQYDMIVKNLAERYPANPKCKLE